MARTCDEIEQFKDPVYRSGHQQTWAIHLGALLLLAEPDHPGTRANWVEVEFRPLDDARSSSLVAGDVILSAYLPANPRIRDGAYRGDKPAWFLRRDEWVAFVLPQFLANAIRLHDRFPVEEPPLDRIRWDLDAYGASRVLHFDPAPDQVAAAQGRDPIQKALDWYLEVLDRAVVDIDGPAGPLQQCDFFKLVHMVYDSPLEANLLIQYLAQMLDQPDGESWKLHGSWITMAYLVLLGYDDQTHRFLRDMALPLYQAAREGLDRLSESQIRALADSVAERRGADNTFRVNLDPVVGQ